MGLSCPFGSITMDGEPKNGKEGGFKIPIEVVDGRKKKVL